MRAAVVEDAEAGIDADAAKLRPVERVLSAKIAFDDEGEPSVLYLAKWQVCSACIPLGCSLFTFRSVL